MNFSSDEENSSKFITPCSAELWFIYPMEIWYSWVIVWYDDRKTVMQSQLKQHSKSIWYANRPQMLSNSLMFIFFDDIITIFRQLKLYEVESENIWEKY